MASKIRYNVVGLDLDNCFMSAGIKRHVGNDCGSVGRGVASDTRGPRFESSHWQTLPILPIFCQLF